MAVTSRYALVAMDPATEKAEQTTIRFCMSMEEGGYKGDGGGEETESAGVRQTHKFIVSDCLLLLDNDGLKYSLVS